MFEAAEELGQQKAICVRNGQFSRILFLLPPQCHCQCDCTFYKNDCEKSHSFKSSTRCEFSSHIIQQHDQYMSGMMT